MALCRIEKENRGRFLGNLPLGQAICAAGQIILMPGPFMDDVKTDLVEVIVKLAAARKLREKQFREKRLLQESGKDISAVTARLEESKRFIREVSLEGKALAAKLFKRMSPGDDELSR